MGSYGADPTGLPQYDDIATGGDELWRLREENAKLTEQLATSEQMRKEELEYMQQNYDTVNEMFNRELEKLSAAPADQNEQVKELSEKLVHMEAALRESIAVQEQQAEMLDSSEETIAELQQQAFRAAKEGVSRANSSGKIEMENMHLVAQLKDAELALAERDQEIVRLQGEHGQNRSSEPDLPASMDPSQDLRQRLEQAEQELLQQRESAESELKQVRDEVSLLTEELEVAKEEAAMLRAEKEEMQLHRDEEEDLFDELLTIEEDATYGEEIIEVDSGATQDELHAAATTVQRAWRKRASAFETQDNSVAEDTVETAVAVANTMAEATEAELNAAATTVQKAWRKRTAGAAKHPQEDDGAGSSAALQELKKTKEALESNLKQAKEALEPLQVKNAQLAEELDALRERLSEQDKKLQENLHAIADLREQQLTAHGAAATIGADADAQEQEAMELSIELEAVKQSLGEEIDSLKKHNSELQQNLEAQRSLVNSLSAQAENGPMASALESSQTVAMVAESEYETAELVESKSAAESNAADMETEVEKLREVNSSLREELSVQIELMAKMKENQAAADCAGTDHLEELKTTKELLAAAKAEKLELQAELLGSQAEEPTEELYNLQQELEATQETLLQLEAEKIKHANAQQQEVVDMRAALSALQEDNSRLQQELAEAVATEAAPRPLLSVSRRHSEDAAFQADEALKDIVDHVELEQLREKTAVEESQMAAYAAEIVALKGTLADRAQQLTDMQSATDYAAACAASDYEYEVERYTKRISQLQKSLGEKSNIIKELNGKIAELTPEPTEEGADESPAVEADDRGTAPPAAPSAADEVARLTTQVADLTAAVEEKANTISELEAKLLRHTDALEAADRCAEWTPAALEEKMSAMAALEAKLCEAPAAADASSQEAELTRLLDQVQALTAELEDKTQSIQVLEAQLSSRPAEDSAASHGPAHQPETSDDAEQIHEMVGELHSEIERLQGQLQGQSGTAAQERPSIPQDQPWFVAPEGTAVTHLQEELAEVHALLEEKAGVVSELEAALAKKTRKAADLSAAIYEKEEQLAAATAQLKEAKADLRETTIRLEGSQTLSRTTRRSMGRDSMELLDGDLTKAMETMGESVTRVSDVRVANLQAGLERLKDENAELAGELEEQKAIVADLSGTCEQLDAHYRAAMELSEQRKREITKLVAEAMKQSDFICDLKSDALTKHIKLQEAQERGEELEREVTVMRAKANGLASVLDEHEPASLDTLRRRLQDAEAALHKKEKSLRTVSQELKAGQRIWKDINKVLQRDPVSTSGRSGKVGVQDLASQPEPRQKKNKINKLRRPRTPPTPPIGPNATRAAWGSD